MLNYTIEFKILEHTEITQCLFPFAEKKNKVIKKKIRVTFWGTKWNLTGPRTNLEPLLTKARISTNQI